jgi:hypothetical protein
MASGYSTSHRASSPVIRATGRSVHGELIRSRYTAGAGTSRAGARDLAAGGVGGPRSPELVHLRLGLRLELGDRLDAEHEFVDLRGQLLALAEHRAGRARVPVPGPVLHRAADYQWLERGNLTRALAGQVVGTIIYKD